MENRLVVARKFRIGESVAWLRKVAYKGALWGRNILYFNCGYTEATTVIKLQTGEISVNSRLY